MVIQESNQDSLKHTSQIVFSFSIDGNSIVPCVRAKKLESIFDPPSPLSLTLQISAIRKSHWLYLLNYLEFNSVTTSTVRILVRATIFIHLNYSETSEMLLLISTFGFLHSVFDKTARLLF